MRCLLLTNHFYPESFRCNDVAFELVRRGYEVTVLTAIPDYPQGRYHKGYSLFKKRYERLNGVKVVRVPIIPRGNGKPLRMLLNYGSGIFFFFFHALYQGLFHKYDCIFVHDTSPAFIGLPAVLVKKMQRIPMDFWILDMWPQSLAAGGIRNARVYRWIDCMMDFIYRNSEVIHISSLGFRQLLRQRNVPDEKIEYLPNWSDDSIVHTRRVDIPRLPDGFIIMFAGNLGEAQNLDGLFQNVLGKANESDVAGFYLLVLLLEDRSLVVKFIHAPRQIIDIGTEHIGGRGFEGRLQRGAKLGDGKHQVLGVGVGRLGDGQVLPVAELFQNGLNADNGIEDVGSGVALEGGEALQVKVIVLGRLVAEIAVSFFGHPGVRLAFLIC